MPDFSYSGYRASEVQIPTVLAKVFVGDPVEDNTRAIQDAIDQVSRLEANSDGFRGAVLIPPGIYRLEGSLQLNVSGVVLRGSGVGQHGTTLVATGVDQTRSSWSAGKLPERWARLAPSLTRTFP